MDNKTVFDYDVEFFRCIELTRELVEVLSDRNLKSIWNCPFANTFLSTKT